MKKYKKILQRYFDKPEAKRKAGSKCKCCQGIISKRGFCYCKTILD